MTEFEGYKREWGDNIKMVHGITGYVTMKRI
jgi:CelD/BcsL family acetyltransferase involved in cellulose biosynthesis